MVTHRRRVLYLSLASLLNFCVFIVAWDSLGIFANAQPPWLSIGVISLSITALVGSVWAAKLAISKASWRRIILLVAIVAALATIGGEILVLNSADGSIGPGLLPAAGTVLHVLLAVLLFALCFLRNKSSKIR